MTLIDSNDSSNFKICSHLLGRAMERLERVEEKKTVSLFASLEKIVEKNNSTEAISCCAIKMGGVLAAASIRHTFRVLKQLPARIFLKGTPNEIRNFKDDLRMAKQCLVLAICAIAFAILKLFCSAALMRYLFKAGRRDNSSLDHSHPIVASTPKKLQRNYDRNIQFISDLTEGKNKKGLHLKHGKLTFNRFYSTTKAEAVDSLAQTFALTQAQLQSSIDEYKKIESAPNASPSPSPSPSPARSELLQNKLAAVFAEFKNVEKVAKGLKEYTGRIIDLKKNSPLVKERSAVLQKAVQSVLDSIAKDLKEIVQAGNEERSVALMQKVAASRDEELRVATFLQLILKKDATSIGPTEVFFSQRAVIAGLSQLYGRRAVQEVFNFYAVKPGDLISTNLLEALVIGIQANLTMVDVEQSYKNRRGSALITIYPELNDASWPETFDDLSEEKLCEFLELLRSKTSGEARALERCGNKPFCHQIGKDLAFLTATRKGLEEYSFDLNDSSKLKKLKQSFGYSEFFARDLVYSVLPYGSAHTSDGVLFSFFDPKRGGKKSCRQILPHVNVPGLLGMNIIPTDKSEGPLTVQTVFRGTYDWSAVWRDAAVLWPGHKECAANKKVMEYSLLEAIDLVKKIKEKQGRPVEEKIALDAIGHSLGAADAQRMTAITAGMMAKGKLDPRLIGSIEQHSWNPPAVARKTNRKFMKKCAELEKQGLLPKIQLNYFKVAYDGVALAGHCLLGHGKNPPAALKTSVFKFVRQVARSRIQTHVLPVLSHTMEAGKKIFSAKENPNYLEDVRSSNAEHLKMLKEIHPESNCCTDESRPEWQKEEERASDALMVHYFQRVGHRFKRGLEAVFTAIEEI